MNNEIWVNVKGFEGQYQVSNLGRFKTLSRECNTGFGNVSLPEKIMKLEETKLGYYRICFHKNGKAFRFQAHRVVAETFLPHRTEGRKFINHKNGVKLDNRPENLEWCTASENCKHALLNKLRIPKRGDDAIGAKLVLDKITGIFYGTVKEAAFAKDIKYSTMKYRLRNNTTQMTFA